MKLEVKKYLLDILESIGAIDTYLSGKRDFKEFEKSPITKDAVIRRLEIIGEAMNRILSINPDISISNSRKITGLRNKIAHEYDDISIENIWAIIVNHLPVLKKEAEQLLLEK